MKRYRLIVFLFFLITLESASQNRVAEKLKLDSIYVPVRIAIGDTLRIKSVGMDKILVYFINQRQMVCGVAYSSVWVVDVQPGWYDWIATWIDSVGLVHRSTGVILVE